MKLFESYITTFSLISFYFFSLFLVFDIGQLSLVFSCIYLSCTLLITNSLLSNYKALTIETFDILIVFFTLLLLVKNQIANTSIYLLLFLLTYSYFRIVRSKVDLTIIYVAILTTAVLFSITTYLIHFEVSEIAKRYCIIYHNSAIYGGCIGIYITIIIAFLIFYVHKKSKIIYASTIILSISFPAFIINNSRASWIALFIVILTLLSIKYRYYLAPNKKKLIVCFLLISVLILATYFLRPNSAKGRFLIWKVSVEMILDKPILGHGIDGFKRNYMHYQANYLKTKGNNTDKYLASNNYLTYNEPIRVLVEYGIVGLVVYLAIWYIIFYKTGRKDFICITCKAIFLFYLVFGLLSFPKQILFLQLVLLLSFVLLMSRTEGKYLTKTVFSLSRKTLMLGGGLVAFLSFSYTANLHLSLKKFDKLLKDKKEVSSQEKVKQYKHLEEVMSEDVFFMTCYSKLLMHNENYTEALKKFKVLEEMYPHNELYIEKGYCYQQLKNYRLAEENYWYSHDMVPSRQRARAKLALLYMEMGLVQDARNIAKEVLNEEVKVYGFETYRIHQELKQKILNE